MSFRASVIIFISALIFSSNNFVWGQNDVRVPRSSFKTNKEGFREAWRHIKKGNEWVDKGSGAIAFALDQYHQAYLYNPDCPELNYKLGMCYLRSDQKAKAEKYIKAAFDAKPEMTKDIRLQLAKAYHYNYEFDKAIVEYNTFNAWCSRRQKKKYEETVFKLIEQCNTGKELKAKAKRVVIQNMGEAINSPYNDYNAIVLKDSIMYFSSRRPQNPDDEPKSLNYFYDEDVYMSVVRKKVWQGATYITDKNINTQHNDAIVWVTYDNQKRYTYDGYRRDGDILLSQFDTEDKEWKKPKRFRRNFNTSMQESALSLTKDEQTAYFVSNDDSENFGGKDIYVCKKDENDVWGEIQNIGSVINTPEDEDAVCVSADGNTLYFSSKGHPGMGGYDIFKCEKKSNGSWSKPENMGYPINTPDDDLFYRPSLGGKYAYYAAKRPDTKGGYDIYKVINLGSEKKMEMSIDEKPIAWFENPQLLLSVPELIKVDTSYYISGKIVDAKTGKPVAAKLDLVDIEQRITSASANSDSSGFFRVSVNRIKNYGIEIRAKDYMIYLDVFAMVKPTQGNELIRNFAINKLEIGAKIVLKNIYFESGKAIVTAASYPELDKVVKFLQDNPDLKIEISGHTDNVGVAATNIKLSAARAKAVVDYIASKGINKANLVSKGYGPAQPIAPNTTPAGKKLNRRVEFKILSKE